jgi:hypothetical protein
MNRNIMKFKYIIIFYKMQKIYSWHVFLIFTDAHCIGTWLWSISQYYISLKEFFNVDESISITSTIQVWNLENNCLEDMTNCFLLLVELLDWELH